MTAAKTPTARILTTIAAVEQIQTQLEQMFEGFDSLERRIEALESRPPVRRPAARRTTLP